MSDPETGLDAVTSYVVYWDNGSSGEQWVVLVEEHSEDLLTFSHTEKTGIIRAAFYQFYYIAVNQQGYGQPSQITTIQATSRPSQI